MEQSASPEPATGRGQRRVLVSTISPLEGGVPVMTRFVVDLLARHRWTPVLAHYEPYSRSPRLSVPAYRLLQQRPGKALRTTWNGIETHAIGAWLPELEFTHYRAGRMWLDLMDSCERHVAVCGNAFAAQPFVQSGRPHTAWIATGWDEDRRDRVRRFSPARRLLDRFINAPVLRRQERTILNAGANLLALSRHTENVLNRIGGARVVSGVLPMPIDSGFFQPDANALVPARIGFSGRIDDPRKNIGLLVSAIDRLVAGGVDVSVMLVGGPIPDAVREMPAWQRIADRVTGTGNVPKERLRSILQTLDVFVIPSFQEGLCIAALEAMACGCPVVSTRCGGPQEYVREDETGYLADFDARSMAGALERIIGDRRLRTHMSLASRRLVETGYSRERCESIFLEAFETTNTRSGGETT